MPSSLNNRYTLITSPTPNSKEYGPPFTTSVHFRADQSHRSHALLARAAP